MERAAELKAKITALGGASPSAGVLTELLRVRPRAVVKLNVTDHIERSSATKGKRHCVHVRCWMEVAGAFLKPAHMTRKDR